METDRGFTEPAGEPDHGNNGTSTDGSDGSLLRELTNHVAELVEYCRQFAQATVDGARGQLHEAMLRLAAGIGVFVIVLALTAAATVCVVYGTALGLTLAFGGREWLGWLSTGLLGLSGSGLWAIFHLKKLRWRRNREAERRHEIDLARQKARYGRNAAEAADESGNI